MNHRSSGHRSRVLADQYLLAGRYELLSSVANHRSDNSYLVNAVDHSARDVYSSMCSKYFNILHESAPGNVIDIGNLKACRDEIERELLIEPINEPMSLEDHVNGMMKDEFLDSLCECYGAELSVVLKFTSQKVENSGFNFTA